MATQLPSYSIYSRASTRRIADSHHPHGPYQQVPLQDMDPFAPSIPFEYMPNQSLYTSPWPNDPIATVFMPSSAHTLPQLLHPASHDSTDDIETFYEAMDEADAFEPSPSTSPTSTAKNASTLISNYAPSPFQERRVARCDEENHGGSELEPLRSPGPPPARTRVKRSHKLVAHSLVERKYRDSLNTELAGLRSAVPQIRENDSNRSAGRLRTSKAMVLAVATDYIKKLEAEVRSLKDGIESLQAEQVKLQHRFP
jgi:hypothetical protein